MNLNEIVVPSDNKTLEVKNGVLFYKKQNALVCYPSGSKEAHYIVPEGTKKLFGGAFALNPYLKTVSIPDGLESIGERAFVRCTSLNLLNIPNSVKKIGDNLFSNQRTPSTVVFVEPGSYAESYCSANMLAYDNTVSTFVDGNTALHYTVSEEGSASVVLGVCKQRILSLPAEINGHPLTEIKDYAFDLNDDMVLASIPNSVTMVGANPFRTCTNLARIYVRPDHPALAVVNNALYQRESRKLISVPSMTADRAYIIPEGMKAIGAFALSCCQYFMDVVIPESVEYIGEDAFYGCSDILLVTVSPDSNAQQYCEEKGIFFTYAQDHIIH